jgi:hypothetical protein
VGSPQTPTGRALNDDPNVLIDNRTNRILAIEAEAQAALVAEVEGLPRLSNIEKDPDHISRGAVLALLSRTASAVAPSPEPRNPEYHEHVAGDEHAHPFSGPHSHGGVSTLRAPVARNHPTAEEEPR